jgi:hypothetical protein
MPAHSSHPLQPLDVGFFTLLKKAYGRFVSDLARRGYNYIDKHDFLVDYQNVWVAAFDLEAIEATLSQRSMEDQYSLRSLRESFGKLYTVGYYPKQLRSYWCSASRCRESA